MKKKAEALATKEEFNELKKQTAELTKMTKEIEAEISGGLWDRQKRWEMKREATFEMSKRISAVDDALSQIYSTRKYYRALAESGQIVDALMKSEAFAKAGANWGRAADAYDSAMALMSIVCSHEVHQTLREFIIFTRKLVPEINTDPQSYIESAGEIAKQLKRIQELLRKELGVDPA